MSQTSAAPKMVRIGQLLLGTGCLTIGGIVVRIFFPNAGLSLPIVLALVPIWAIGLIGIVLWLIGWLQENRQKRQIEPLSGKRVRLFTAIVRYSVVIAVLCAIAFIAFLLYIDVL